MCVCHAVQPVCAYVCLSVCTLAAEMSSIDVPASGEEISVVRYHFSVPAEEIKQKKFAGLLHTSCAAVVVHVCVKEKLCSGSTAYEYFHTLFT